MKLRKDKVVSETTDRNDPRLGYGVNDSPVEQNTAYLVLPEEDRTNHFIRQVRRTYHHIPCGHNTTMSMALAETYAAKPNFYGATYCCNCQMHKAVSEFVWVDDIGSITEEEVGS